MSRIEKQIEKLSEEKSDYQFAIGRALVGKAIHPECNSKDPDLYCVDCDCWKKTREMCS